MSRVTDLCTSTVSSEYNLTMSEALIGDVTTEERVIVETVIKNNGFRSIDSFTVSVLDGAESKVYETTVEKALGIGEESNVKLVMPIPVLYDVETYSVVVNPVGVVDSNANDNEALIEFGRSDLSVNVSRITSGNSSGSVITVTNNGIREENVTLNLRRETSDGEVLSKLLLGTLKAGETADYVLEASRFRPFGKDCSLFVVEVCGNSKEIYSEDNFCNLVIDQKVFELDNGCYVPIFYDVNRDGKLNVLDMIELKILCHKPEGATILSTILTKIYL